MVRALPQYIRRDVLEAVTGEPRMRDGPSRRSQASARRWDEWDLGIGQAERDRGDPS